MSELSKKQCIACQAGTPPLKDEAIEELKKQINAQWELVKEHRIEREFTFKDFKEALEFTNRVGAIAEQEDHHPDIELGWGRVKAILFTHKIDGLSESDFILAAKIDDIYDK